MVFGKIIGKIDTSLFLISESRHTLLYSNTVYVILYIKKRVKLAFSKWRETNPLRGEGFVFLIPFFFIFLSFYLFFSSILFSFSFSFSIFLSFSISPLFISLLISFSFSIFLPFLIFFLSPFYHKESF